MRAERDCHKSIRLVYETVRAERFLSAAKWEMKYFTNKCLFGCAALQSINCGLLFVTDVPWSWSVC